MHHPAVSEREALARLQPSDQLEFRILDVVEERMVRNVEIRDLIRR
jgi:hypothetical protein